MSQRWPTNVMVTTQLFWPLLNVILNIDFYIKQLSYNHGTTVVVTQGSHGTSG